MGAKISQEGFTFDDVLIRPGESRMEPAEASLKTNIAGIALAVPFLSAAMDRVTEAGMAITLGKLGALGILHRNCSIEEQAAMVKEVKGAGVPVGAACGPFAADRAKALDEAGCDVIVIDCAHGHNLNVVASAAQIKKSLKKAKMIFGNIATAEAAKAACSFADAVKVGVGPGSICTTRLISGVGVPQLSAILDVVSIAAKKKVPVIADGGIRTSGDIAKALAAGASAVMLGNLFAGTDEAPGRIVEKDGKRFKEYRGMGSEAVIKSASGNERYFTHGRKAVPEGVEALVPYKGPVEEIVASLSSGIQVGMGYVGARTLAEFAKKAKFIRITHAAIAEGKPHSLSSIADQ
ncbi:MAG: Inosine-5'-monophosphate dehydrogenase [Parcubacteria group bacterium GW2011_GWA2_51_10]|nr:MAG: Inosine-5'-monophosphate dehydrogenase [Parcubacteria group bacterium GW2011_GWA2_51_10]